MAFVWSYVHKYVHIYTSQITFFFFFGLLCALSNSTKIVALLSEAEKIYLFRYWDSALHLKLWGFSDKDFHRNQSDND